VQKEDRAFAAKVALSCAPMLDVLECLT